MGINPIYDGIMGVVDRVLSFIPNPQEKAQARLQAEAHITDLLAANDVAQTEVNKIEAANDSIFVSGWRPFIGWVCGVAMAYKFILQPMIVFFVLISGSSFDPTILPVLDWAEMSTVLLGMLGLGTMRSFEKYNGVAK